MKVPLLGDIPLRRYHEIVVALFKFFFPWALAAFYIISMFIVFGERASEFLGLMGAYFAPFLGRETVVPVAVARGFSPFLVALYITAMDLIIGLFFAWNWDLIQRLPVVGGTFRSFMERGERALEKRPWVGRLAFTGVLIFMAQPIQPGGSITASAFGRIIGLPVGRLMVAIGIGALISSFAYAYAATGILAAFTASPFLGVLSLVILIGVFYYIYKNHILPLENK